MPAFPFPRILIPKQASTTPAQAAYAGTGGDLKAATAVRLGIPLAKPRKPRPVFAPNREDRRAARTRGEVLNSYSRHVWRRADITDADT